MNEFRLHWWQAPNGRINLGDEISPVVFSHNTGIAVVHAGISDCDGIAIGSVFNPRQALRRKRSRALLVWGSGTLKPRSVHYNDLSVDLAALRGPKTAGEIEGCPDIPFGDPGLFVPEIWPCNNTRETPVGIIPHFSMRGSSSVKQLRKTMDGAILIDLTVPDFADTFDRLSGCKLIISSSLHGLIFADAYGIPSLFWNESGPANEWKYQDYFLGVGRTDYCSMDSANIVKVVEHGSVEDLPFSLLPKSKMVETLNGLRQGILESKTLSAGFFS